MVATSERPNDRRLSRVYDSSINMAAPGQQQLSATAAPAPAYHLPLGGDLGCWKQHWASGLHPSSPLYKEDHNYEATLSSEIPLVYAELLAANWPEEYLGPPPEVSEAGLVWPPPISAVTCQQFLPRVVGQFSQLSRIKATAEAMSVHTVMIDEQYLKMMEYPLKAEKIPPLQLLRHHTSKQSRSADAVRQEEYWRLALCWIYRQPVPTEAVHAMFWHGSAAYALKEYASAIRQAIKLLYGARKFADQMGGRIDVSRLVNKRSRRYWNAIASIKPQTGKQSRLQGRYDDDKRAGRPYNPGKPILAPGKVEGPATRREPEFNPQALEAAKRSLTSICIRHGYKWTYAVKHPQEVADQIGVSAQQPVSAGMPAPTQQHLTSNFGPGADVGAAVGGVLDKRQLFAGMNAMGIKGAGSAGIGAGSRSAAKRARH